MCLRKVRWALICVQFGGPSYPLLKLLLILWETYSSYFPLVLCVMFFLSSLFFGENGRWFGWLPNWMAFMDKLAMGLSCVSFSCSFSISLLFSNYSFSFMTNSFSLKSENSLPICCNFSSMRPTYSNFLDFAICIHPWVLPLSLSNSKKSAIASFVGIILPSSMNL